MASPGVETALVHARAVYAALGLFKTCAADGHHTEAGRFLTQALEIASNSLPALQEVITAEAKAAEAFDLTERTLARFFPRLTQPHPDAANDHLGTSDQTHPDFA